MNKEEKKAIERLKLFEYRYVLVQNDDKVIETILNLIKRWQKEIEELKFDNYMVGKWNEYLDKDCISKNRMKEIIKKYIDIEEVLNYTNQEIYREDLKNMISELLGEN